VLIALAPLSVVGVVAVGTGAAGAPQEPRQGKPHRMVQYRPTAPHEHAEAVKATGPHSGALGEVGDLAGLREARRGGGDTDRRRARERACRGTRRHPELGRRLDAASVGAAG
jgi:hypothetical protein